MVNQSDAERLEELRAVARALWPARDHGETLSELTVVMGQVRRLEHELSGAEL